MMKLSSSFIVFIRSTIISISSNLLSDTKHSSTSANSSCSTNVSTDIADLIALNGKTSVDVGAGAVVTITSAATTVIDLTAAGITWASGINVTGTAGADTITGTAGADTIIGGGGGDTLIGGAGNDIFVYADKSESYSGGVPFVETAADFITDFTANGAAGDQIDLAVTVASVGGTVAGTVSAATINDDMTALLDSSTLTDGWNVNNGTGIDAALVHINAGDMAGRSFIAVAITGNDWFGSNDMLIEVTGITDTVFDINVFI